jgi:hypothetical protein
MLYGIFAGTKWGMETNKRRAIKLAKANNAYIKVMKTPGPEYTAFDAPTFKLLSDMLADYRIKS